MCFVDWARIRFRPLGFLRLRSTSSAGIVFPISGETKMTEAEPQSYMGKSPILKGIRKLYRGLWVSCRILMGPRDEDIAANAEPESSAAHKIAAIKGAGPTLGTAPMVPLRLQ